jgi:hypothetical protein
MKPLGHTQARDGRDEHFDVNDDRLGDIWKEYLATTPFAVDDGFSRAMHLLEPLRPSLIDLHRHIFMHDSFVDGRSSTRSSQLGTFISAGYQLLPEKRIIYDLRTPRLHHLGSYLVGKHLIIDGEVGDYAGHHMIGMLTNNGHATSGCGAAMVGTVINRGVTGMSCAKGLYGILIQEGRSRGMPGREMLGASRGVFDNDTFSWTHPARQSQSALEIIRAMLESPLYHDAFIRDITNPDRLEYADLRKHIEKTYWGRL